MFHFHMKQRVKCAPSRFRGILEWGILSLFGCRIWNFLLALRGNEELIFFLENLIWNTEFSVLISQ